MPMPMGYQQGGYYDPDEYSQADDQSYASGNSRSQYMQPSTRGRGGSSASAASGAPSFYGNGRASTAASGNVGGARTRNYPPGPSGRMQGQSMQNMNQSQYGAGFSGAYNPRQSQYNNSYEPAYDPAYEEDYQQGYPQGQGQGQGYGQSQGQYGQQYQPVGQYSPQRQQPRYPGPNSQSQYGQGYGQGEYFEQDQYGGYGDR